jgi:polyisoprenoid-binding protein YceI
VFTATGFEASRVDPDARVVAGVVRGRMTIRGVERPFSMPVQVTVDAGQRLVIEGQAPLSLPDHGVPVPNKLGLITMEEDVQMWIALKARYVGPAPVAKVAR